MSRYLALSDVHANAAALDAVLAAEPDRDGVLFLGDAVDCGPHPDAVCDRLRDLDLVAGVVGNHDRTVLDAAGAGAASASPGGAPNVAPSDDPHARWQAWTHARLSPANRDFLDSLARTATVAVDGATIRLHHGDFPRPDGHEGAWPTRQPPAEDPTVYEAVADRYPEDLILHGHSHYPFEATVAGTTFVNPGSVGLQRDGWSVDRARYATIEDGEVDLRTVTFDADAVRDDSLAYDSPHRHLWDDPGATASSG